MSTDSSCQAMREQFDSNENRDRAIILLFCTSSANKRDSSEVSGDRSRTAPGGQRQRVAVWYVRTLALHPSVDVRDIRVTPNPFPSQDGTNQLKEEAIRYCI